MFFLIYLVVIATIMLKQKPSIRWAIADLKVDLGCKVESKQPTEICWSGSQDFAQVATDLSTVGGVERNNIVLLSSGADHSPKLHRTFTGQGDEVFSKGTDMFSTHLFLAYLFSFDLFDHGQMLVH